MIKASPIPSRRGTKTSFRDIAQNYRDLIDSGAVTSGAPMPTGPEVAAENGVSSATAYKALSQLVDEGYITGDTSGYIVRMSGTERLYAVLVDTLTRLDALGQHLQLTENGKISGKDGSVTKDTAGGWTHIGADGPATADQDTA